MDSRHWNEQRRRYWAKLHRTNQCGDAESCTECKRALKAASLIRVKVTDLGWEPTDAAMLGQAIHASFQTGNPAGSSHWSERDWALYRGWMAEASAALRRFLDEGGQLDIEGFDEQELLSFAQTFLEQHLAQKESQL